MPRGAIIGVGAAAALGLGVSGCVRPADLEPPAVVQFTCTFEPGAPPMTVVIDTGLGTADWLNLAQPRSGRAEVSPHQYRLSFAAYGPVPAVVAQVNRYDATIERTTGSGRTAARGTGRCVKEKTGPRL